MSHFFKSNTLYILLILMLSSLVVLNWGFITNSQLVQVNKNSLLRQWKMYIKSPEMNSCVLKTTMWLWLQAFPTSITFISLSPGWIWITSWESKFHDSLGIVVVLNMENPLIAKCTESLYLNMYRYRCICKLQHFHKCSTLLWIVSLRPQACSGKRALSPVEKF